MKFGKVPSWVGRYLGFPGNITVGVVADGAKGGERSSNDSLNILVSLYVFSSDGSLGQFAARGNRSGTLWFVLSPFSSVSSFMFYYYYLLLFRYPAGRFINL